MTTVLRASPGAGLAALAHLLTSSAALRHPRLARDAARRGLPGLVRLAAARHPDRIALVGPGATLTTTELAREVGGIAATLRHAPGSRVGVRSDGGPAFVATLAAAVAAGLDAVPLGPRLAPADVAALALDDEFAPHRAPRGADIPDGRGRLLLLTTGTTGAPVATARGRMGLRALAQLADAGRRTALPLDGPLLLLAPPDHGHGLSALAGALLRGIPVVLASGLRPEEQHALVVEQRPSSVSGVPAQLARLLEAGGLGAARVVVAGSSTLAPGLRARLEETGATVHDGFGATATGTVAIDGRPLAGVRLRRADDGAFEVRSPLGGDVWRSTGDRVEFRDGRVVPAGRLGPLVDSGGELLDPDRLRRVLSAHPGVADVAVTLASDDLLGRVLHARVDADPSLEPALRAAIAEALARAEHPRRLEFGPL